MRCRNCGADLKPGINYCLECGSFLDEEDTHNNDSGPGEIITNNDPIDFGTQNNVIKKRKRRRKMKTSDMLIYLGLALVFIVSIIVIIVAVVNGKEEEVVVPPTTTTEEKDKIVSVDNYKVNIDGSLSYEVQGSILYISDNDNYTFTYRNTDDDYDKYSKDMTLLSDDLKESNYQLLDTDKITVNSHEFLIYQIIANSKTKYLYLTKVNKNYLSMGIIESLDSGNWKLGLDVIADLNDSIEFETTIIEKEITTTEKTETIITEEQKTNE